MEHVVGIDLGGTHVAAAVMTTQGQVLHRHECDIDRFADPQVILRQHVAGAVRTAMQASEVARIRGVGMGVPGNLDRVSGICRYSPNFRWHDVPIVAPLSDELQCPVFILNDVRTHTLGELHFGAGKGLKSFALLALGTGIGGGVVVNGRLLEGAHSAAGEAGHISVEPDGPECGCGNRGCVEALAAAPAITRLAQEAASRGEAPMLLKLAGSVDAISPLTLTQAGEAGDPAALALWERIGTWLGRAIASIIAVSDPEQVLVGGKVARAGEMLLAPARLEAGRRFRMIPPGTTPIVAATLGDEAGLIGGAALALESLGYLESALAPVPDRVPR
ncbi:MAG: ROK family protein [Candidatus Xenobia bacterium]